MIDVQENPQKNSKTKKRWKKILLATGLSLFLLIFGIALATIILFQSISIPSIIVKQTENLFNVRVQTGELKIRWFPPLGVHLNNFSIFPRDKVADQGIPLEDRDTLDNTKAVFFIPTLDLSLEVSALILQQKILVHTFLLSGLQAQLSLSKKGNLNFLPLLSTPKIVNGEKNPNLIKRPETKPIENPPFDVRNLPVSGLVKKLGIENGEINFTLGLTGNRFSLQDFDLILTNIDVDPQNLEEHNKADVDFGLNLLIYTKAQKETGEIKITSSGSVAPFSAKTGQINPDIIYKLSFLPKSYLSGYGLFEPLNDFAKDLAKIGLKRDDLTKLLQRFELTRKSSLAIRFFQSKIELLQDARLNGQEFSLGLNKKSWLKINSLSQFLRGQFEIEPLASQNSVFEGIDQDLAKQGGISIEEAREIRVKYFAPITVINNGKEGLGLQFQATGSLTDPQIQLTVASPDLNRLIEEVLQKRLEAEKKKLEENLRNQVEEKVQEVQQQTEAQRKAAEEEVKQKAEEKLREELQKKIQGW